MTRFTDFISAALRLMIAANYANTLPSRFCRNKKSVTGPMPRI